MRLTKYTLAVLLIAAISLSACRKHNNSTTTGIPANAEYFIFGKVSGFCPGQCAQYYKVSGKQVHKSYFDSTGHLQYSNTPMSPGTYGIVSRALTDFPSYLYLNPNKDIRCDNCADMPFVHLEYKLAEQVYQWNIDYPYEGIPADVRPYMDELMNIFTGLD